MPKMISMKKDPDDSNDWSYSPSVYPSGLTLYINEDQCEALGITKAIKAGTAVTISAKAIITSSTESLDTDGDSSGNDVNISLQITDMGITVEGVVKSAAQILYGSAS